MQSAAVITCDKLHLEARCRERGYSLEEVMGCVVSQEGDIWTIDTRHPDFPMVSRLPSGAGENVAATGPGAALKKMLAGWPFRIVTTDSCPCNAMARQMDEWGCDECEVRMEEIVAHLRAQAATRGLPFIDAAGRFLIKRAIKNARKSLIDP